ncbi:MAG TPA: glycoside hydrolase family 16 protein [Jatrophihabitans sp.]|jgi:beta-glucanase (GH16 family)|uniref:glycoside hydrolase family 16 protein n=1 Tax=Jatrophihabitans sp. TaxID=1932789 RepID=UPI002E08C0D8|nr:glycoside hydrolase family 16 protein [Jatrophihabitans sp.]
MRALPRRTAAVPAAVFLVVVMTLSTALAGGAGAATLGSTRSATAHMTVFVRATARATVSVTESATVTVAGFTASSRATAARSAASTAGAWGTAGAWAAARAPRASLAIARARWMAESVALHRATARAQATAARRAFVDARQNAQASAVAAARAAATSRARSEAGAAYTASKRAPSPAPAPCGGLTPAKPGGGTYVCSFDDEFNGTSLNSAAWTPVTTANAGTGEGGVCYVDSPDNISVSGGYLNLTVRKLSTPMTCQAPAGSYSTSYTGGNVATWGKFTQTYGRFAVRASFPASTVAGLQSSLWLYPQTMTYGAWPLSGEMDIAEEYSQYADRAVPFLHYGFDPSTVDPATSTNIDTNTNCMVSDVHAFHEYVLDWRPGNLTISFDGQTCLVDNYVASGLTGAAPFDNPFFIALTQALGSTTNALTAATQLPATTRVDYVRVWK